MKGLSLLLLLSSALFLPVHPAFAGAPTWVEAHSPNFIVMTDSNAKQAVHLADQFERMRAVLHTLCPTQRSTRPRPSWCSRSKTRKPSRLSNPPTI